MLVWSGFVHPPELILPDHVNHMDGGGYVVEGAKVNNKTGSLTDEEVGKDWLNSGNEQADPRGNRPKRLVRRT